MVGWYNSLNMVRKDNTWEKIKRIVLPVVSGVGFVLIVWMVFYGRIKVTGLLAPLIDKLPKNEADMIRTTENVLGSAVEKIINGGKTKQIIEQGAATFEESKYTEPAREMRDELKKKMDDAIQSAKALPAQEIKHIQVEVCRQWLGEEMVATKSGEN